jgi:hypothetical protein
MVMPYYSWPHRCKEYVKALPVHPMTKVSDLNWIDRCLRKHMLPHLHHPVRCDEEDDNKRWGLRCPVMCLRPTSRALP